MIEGKPVYVTAWLYVIESITGGKVPVLFLDTDIPENTSEDRTIPFSVWRRLAISFKTRNYSWNRRSENSG